MLCEEHAEKRRIQNYVFHEDLELEPRFTEVLKRKKTLYGSQDPSILVFCGLGLFNPL